MRGEKTIQVCKCNKKFEDYVSNKRSGFCSLKCYWKSKKGVVGYWMGKKRPHMVGDKNPKWKGNKVGYAPLHQWVKRRLGTPSTCEKCGFENTSNYKIHWANLSGKYQRVDSDWVRLCVPCHSKFDRNRKLFIL